MEIVINAHLGGSYKCLVFFEKNKEPGVVVKTNAELKNAIKNKESVIIVRGELVGKLKWRSKFKTAASAASFGVALAAAVAALAVPASAPISSFVASYAVKEAAGAAVGITGKELVPIIVASGLSVVTIIAVLKDYKIQFKKGDMEMVLTRIKQ